VTRVTHHAEISDNNWTESRDDKGRGAMHGRPHVTLEDVARAATVSLATASRVLNGTANVRPDLRERVLTAADALAYTPNAHAQALAGASRYTVGLLCHDLADPAFGLLARGALRVAGEHGALVMLASTFGDPDREVECVAALRAQRVSAIVLTGSGYEDRGWQRAMTAVLDPYRRAGGQVAAIGRHRGLKVDTVQPENRRAAGALARTLLELGHRRFAVLTGPGSLSTAADRFQGFREAVRRGKGRLDDADVAEGPMTRDGGYAAMRELIARGLRATCVVAASDAMAAGALTALRGARISVPRRVSLAAFEDLGPATDLNPPLTTVSFPLERTGELAMELLFEGGNGERTRVRRVAGEVIVRASTAAPR
jgi:LacI family transcriptional regulator